MDYGMITWYVWVDSNMRATSLLVLRLHARFNDDFMVQDMVLGETEGSRFMLRLNPPPLVRNARDKRARPLSSKPSVAGSSRH